MSHVTKCYLEYNATQKWGPPLESMWTISEFDASEPDTSRRCAKLSATCKYYSGQVPYKKVGVNSKIHGSHI